MWLTLSSKLFRKETYHPNKMKKYSNIFLFFFVEEITFLYIQKNKIIIYIIKKGSHTLKLFLALLYFCETEIERSFFCWNFLFSSCLNLSLFANLYVSNVLLQLLKTEEKFTQNLNKSKLKISTRERTSSKRELILLRIMDRFSGTRRCGSWTKLDVSYVLFNLSL